MKTSSIENSPVGSRTTIKHGDGGREETGNSLDKRQKSILVIDTPKDCGHCRLSDFVDGDSCLCRKADRKSKSNEKPKWCPLKSLPQKKNTDFHPNIVYANGWNDCLDAITGETE